jgi:FKBP-type peptidyl-prolyl cis-trans isomerase
MAAVAALALSLVACSTGGSSAAACAPTKPGTASAKIKVTGKVGAVPKATFPAKLSTTKTERTQLKAGKGRVAKSGDTVEVNFALYNATTGTELTESATKTGSPLPIASGGLPGLNKAMKCSAAGARVVAIIPPVDAFGSTGASQLGVGATDSIIFVADVIKVIDTPTPTPTPTPSVSALPRANGTPEKLPAGYPTVKLAASGAPTITTKGAAPTKLEIADLKKGSGATVASGDTVTVHYTGIIWGTNKVFDSSWTRGTPASFATTGVIPGFSKALVGQKVGSQVVAIIPPAEGYGAAGTTGIKGTDTIVFVVDILATAK